MADASHNAASSLSRVQPSRVGYSSMVSWHRAHRRIQHEEMEVRTWLKHQHTSLGCNTCPNMDNFIQNVLTALHFMLQIPGTCGTVACNRFENDRKNS